MLHTDDDNDVWESENISEAQLNTKHNWNI